MQKQPNFIVVAEAELMEKMGCTHTLNYFSTEVALFYSVVSVSGIQQSDSYVNTHKPYWKESDIYIYTHTHIR